MATASYLQKKWVARLKSLDICPYKERDEESWRIINRLVRECEAVELIKEQINELIKEVKYLKKTQQETAPRYLH